MQLYDLHIHTHLSICASKTNTSAIDYVREAEKGSLCAIGFTDHALGYAGVRRVVLVRKSGY